MFIRLNTSKRTKNPVVQVIESYRQDGRVRQRIVASLGAARSSEDLAQLEKLAYDLISKLESEKQRREIQKSLFPDELSQPKPPIRRSKPIDPRNLEHESTVFDGFDVVISALLSEANFEQLAFSSGRKQDSAQGLEILRLLLAQMWDCPASKLRSFNQQEAHGYSGIRLENIYRFMDRLVKREKDVLRTIFQAIYGRLAPRQVDCMFVDVTTLYFESVCQDELRAFGYSKDQKFHNVQIVLCLVVNGDGIPLTFKVFKGNTAEVKTLLPVLQEIKDEFAVSSVTIVADRGMVSCPNIEGIAALGFTWITAAKIKHLSSSLALNDLSSFVPLKQEHESDEDIRYKVVDHPTYPDSNLLVTYSPRRAQKDARDREKIMDRLQAKLGSEGEKSRRAKKLVTNAGYRQFVRFSEPGKWELNQDAVANAENWDGFHAIAFSKKLKMPIQNILAQYKGLWRIEEAFRVGKNHLEIRPMFHWTEKRIRAHVLICFIGLFLERYLEVRLKTNGASLTPGRIRSALRDAHTINLKDPKTRQKIRLPSRLSADAKHIFKTLGLALQRTTVVAAEE